MNKFRKHILLTLILTTIFGCSKEVKTGILSFQLTSPSTEIMLAPLTKATISDAELADFTVSIPKAEISDTYKSIKGQTFTLLAGNYSASAENCTEQIAEITPDAFGRIRYTGAQNFDVSAGNQTSVTIPCTVANAKISVLLKEDFLSIFDPVATTVVISKNTERTARPLEFRHFSVLTDSGTSAVSMTDASANATRYAFYPASSTLYIQIITRKTGATESVIYSVSTPVLTTTATWHKITIGANQNSTSGGITINSTSNSINNGFCIDGYQNGTATEDL